jgi:hypothetical protein
MILRGGTFLLAGAMVCRRGKKLIPKRVWMKSIYSIVVAAACALVGSPAWAAIEIAEAVEYLQSAAPDEACTWEAGMVSSTVAKSKGFITVAAKTSATSGLRLSLQVPQLKLTRAAKNGEYSLVVRANVADAGKLIATRDFQDDKSFKSGASACDALRGLGASLGENVAGWVSKMHFMECRDDCDGIHPDEPIAVGAQILIGRADALNDTVRNECRWPTAMVSLLLKTYNDNDPPPRAKLESRAIDIEKYPGRRLVLRVIDVHALAGGGWTGPKWMDMSGELWDGKTMVANFDSHTNSGRSLSTCGSVESLSESTADMIVEWLRSPSLGASLR